MADFFNGDAKGRIWTYLLAHPKGVTAGQVRQMSVGLPGRTSVPDVSSHLDSLVAGGHVSASEEIIRGQKLRVYAAKGGAA